jgi:hypothetical protein
MSYGAKLQLCFFSSDFWGAPCFPFIGIEVLFLVLRVGRSFKASRLLGFVYIIDFFHFTYHSVRSETTWRIRSLQFLLKIHTQKKPTKCVYKLDLVPESPWVSATAKCRILVNPAFFNIKFLSLRNVQTSKRSVLDSAILESFLQNNHIKLWSRLQRQYIRGLSYELRLTESLSDEMRIEMRISSNNFGEPRYFQN